MLDIKKEFKGREVELSPASLEQERLPAKEAESLKEITEIAPITYVPDQLVKQVTAPPVAGVIGRTVSEIQQKIEDILEQDLLSVYQELTPEKKMQFKIKGEQTAQKISVLLQAVKIKIQEVIRLILDWLGLLSNINKHFIHQEAKIKAEKILKLKRT